MSDFFEKAENQRLLKKIELKQNSGMNIKRDTIQLIAAAFDSMTDEDWIEYERQSARAAQLFEHYFQNMPKLPLPALFQIIQTIPSVLSDYEKAIHEQGSNVYDYNLLFVNINTAIANYNDILQLYGDADTNYALDIKTYSFNHWKSDIVRYCQDFISTKNGQALRIIQQYLSFAGLYD